MKEESRSGRAGTRIAHIYVPVMQYNALVVPGSPIINANRAPQTHQRRLRLPGSGRDNTPAAWSKSCTPRDGRSMYFIWHPGCSHGEKPSRPLVDRSPGRFQTRLGHWRELRAEAPLNNVQLPHKRVGARDWEIGRGQYSTTAGHWYSLSTVVRMINGVEGPQIQSHCGNSDGP